MDPEYEDEELHSLRASKFPSWTMNKKPSSIIQSIILNEVNSGAPRQLFCWEAHIMKQLHKSRANNCQPGEDSLQQPQKKKLDRNKNEIVSSSRMTAKKEKGNGFSATPHLELKADFLELIDAKIIKRLKGPQGNIFSFSEIQPALSKETRTTFCVTTKGKFGKYDTFYPSCLPVVSSADRKLLHPTLFLIPPNGKSLQLYSLITGDLEYSMDFEGPIKYDKVTFYHVNGTILLNSRKTTLTSDVFDDILQFSYPPLSLMAHIQVKKSAVKKSNITSLEFTDEYVIGYSSTMNSSTKKKAKTIILYDFDKLLSKSKNVWWTKSDASSPTHIIEEFTDGILVQVTSCDSFMSFDYNESPVHYLTKESKEQYELFRLTRNGPYKVQSLNLPDESPVNFLRNYGPRILTKDKETIRIWTIDYTQEADGLNELVTSKLSSKPLFEKNYNGRPSTINGNEVPSSFKKGGLRKTPRISYQEEDVTLEMSENEFLMQLAVVRFARRSVKVYIYDSYSYALQYKLNPHIFSPRKDELYDRILVHFMDNIIAVHKIATGGREKKIYTFNLLRGLL